MDGKNSNPWKKTIEEKQNLSISHRCGWCVSSIRDAGHFKSHSKKIENMKIWDFSKVRVEVAVFCSR